MISQFIEKQTVEIEPELIELRHFFHRNPELSNKEFKTAGHIADRLESLGINVTRGVAGTGVVGILSGERPGPCIALRADIDALPVPENTNAEYSSVNPGVSHACGHDAHAAIGLGVANVLSHFRKNLRGTVKFIFQPAEEMAVSDENGGAFRMIRDGVLKNPDIQKIYALHVMPSVDAGYVGFSEAAWASNDMIEIMVKGKRTHGAYPHTGVDSILVASHIFIALQNMISRLSDARNPCVVSIGRIEGGDQFNVIPGSVRMAGIIRTLDPVTRHEIQGKIGKVIHGIAESFGAEYELNISAGLPVTMNDPALLGESVARLKEILGADRVLSLKPQMGSEDFALFANEVPGFYFMLGVRNPEKGITHMLHTSEFNIDESALRTGVNALSRLIYYDLSTAGLA